MDDVDLAWFNGFYAGFWAHRDGKPCRHGYGPGDHHWEAGTCLSQDSADLAETQRRDEPPRHADDCHLRTCAEPDCVIGCSCSPPLSCVRCGQYGVRGGLDHTPCEPSA